MKVNELKIGDRIKFETNKFTNIGYIYNFHRNIIGVSQNPEGSKQFCAQNWIISTDDIISKLEPLVPQYKEIPIEKEMPKMYQFLCPKCSGFHGMEINQYNMNRILVESKYCNKCKEKSAPKSFSFDMEYINKLEINQSPLGPGYFPEAFFKINASRILNYPSKELEGLSGKKVKITLTEIIE